MSTIIIEHDDCSRHNPGESHPESIQRIKAVQFGLEGLKGLQRLPAPYAGPEQINRVHPAVFWEELRAAEPSEGRVQIDPDTFVNNGSIDAALRAGFYSHRTMRQILAI